MLKDSIWKMREFDIETVKSIMEYKQVPYIIACILANRGIVTEDALDSYYKTSKDGFHDPFKLLDMQVAVNRILTARDKEEIIYIYGDYDVDGVTSTSILYMFLDEIGCNIEYYIPSRHDEGYGINIEAIDKIIALGARLMISVDTGITAIKQVKHANKQGLNVIITDHHECQEEIPDALAVINPKRDGDNYPFDALAGVGVTFKLIQAIGQMIGVENKIWKYLDIVAVGTVADIVPLVDENRLMTKMAFKTMSTTWNTGLAALLSISKVKDKKITAGRIGFGIGPRLNAAGRIGHASQAVDLFINKDKDYCEKIAEELNQVNKERQLLEKLIFKEAVNIIETTMDPKKEYILVVASENWHHGVIGIVASRLVEKYYRPVIILAIDEDVASGSARSIEGFSIFSAINEYKYLLDKFGGHEMAAGMSLATDNISLFAKKLNEYGATHITDDLLKKKINIDISIDTKEITVDLINQLQTLEPFGRSNPQPVFLVKDKVRQIKKIGKNNDHLRLDIGEENVIQGIGFSIGEVDDWLGVNQQVQVICNLEINEWRQVINPQMIIKDIRHEEKIYKIIKEIIDIHIATNGYRENFKKKHILVKTDIANIYRYLKEKEYLKVDKIYYTDIQLVLLSGNIDMLDKVFMALVVLEDVGLLKYALNEFYMNITLIHGEKVDLKDSKMYNEFLV